MSGPGSEALAGKAEQTRRAANAAAVDRMLASQPALIDVAPAGQVVPGMTANMILTSGAPLAWEDYFGGQRRAILFAAVHEGLAPDPETAAKLIADGTIILRSTQQHSCIGSVAGIYTASMPVFVVEDSVHGNRAFCSLYEGPSRKKLNYGAYDADVGKALNWLRDELAPVLAQALALNGPMPLKPIMARALRLGDELHSRNTAGTMLFGRELNQSFLKLYASGSAARVSSAIDFLAENDYSFLRLSMAASKAMADAAHGVDGSSIVTGMAINCRDFAIRVSGLGDAWFRGKHPRLLGRFFDGFTEADAEWIGGESCVTETVGLGGFAQACAPTLQAYQGGTYEAMLRSNERMYAITEREHDSFLLPPFEFRGSPTGIDIFKVLQTGITPVIDGGLAGKEGGQIGAGVLQPELDCFELAAVSWREKFAG